MKFSHANRLLRSADPEAQGGGAAVLDAPAAAAPPAPVAAAPPAAAAEKEPTRLEMIAASIKGKGALLAERDAATLRATTAEASLVTATAELTTLRAELAALKGHNAEIDQLLATARTEATTVEAAAAAQVAALGFEAANLPEATSDAADTVEKLEAKLEKETDPKQIVLLSRQVDALKAKNAKG